MRRRCQPRLARTSAQGLRTKSIATPGNESIAACHLARGRWETPMSTPMSLAGWIGKLALAPLARALPAMSETERVALQAGTVGFEGDLFAGQPDFDALLARGPNELTSAECDFLDRDVVQLCALLDDWEIEQARDLPPLVWQFLREHKFFGMIIPAEYGGLGFSHHAHAT